MGRIRLRPPVSQSYTGRWSLSPWMPTALDDDSAVARLPMITGAVRGSEGKSRPSELLDSVAITNWFARAQCTNLAAHASLPTRWFDFNSRAKLRKFEYILWMWLGGRCGMRALFAASIPGICLFI